MRIIKGKKISKGISIGPVFHYKSDQLYIPDYNVDESEVEQEIDNFYLAINNCIEELQQTRELVLHHLDENHAKIIDSQLMILDDTSFHDEVISLIKNKNNNAIKAFNKVITVYEEKIAESNSSYHQQRDIDIRDIKKRILHHLINNENYIDGQIDSPSILVSHSISPSDFFNLEPKNITGIITTEGGSDSHLAIVAKAFGLPYISGIEKLDLITDQDEIILDANEEKIIVNPVSSKKKDYRKELAEYKKQQNRKIEIVDETKDGTPFDIKINIEFIEELQGLDENSYKGIGLFRTEFLGLERNAFPSEEEQYQVYRKVLETVGDKPLVFRTFDFGRDKFIDMLDMEMFHTDEAYKDWGGIRLCLENPTIMKNQFKAMLRCSKIRSFKIMLPMISSVEEVRQAKEICHEAEAEIENEHVSCDNIDIGAMVETKSILYNLRELAEEVEFFSIGTNDLAYFLLGSDRKEDSIIHHYHPKMFKAIRKIVKAGQEKNIPVTLCGEMGADPYALLGLAAVGIRSVSVSTNSLAQINEEIKNLDIEQMGELDSLIFNCEDSETVLSILKEYYENFTGKQIEANSGTE